MKTRFPDSAAPDAEEMLSRLVIRWVELPMRRYPLPADWAISTQWVPSNGRGA